jgi:N-acetyl-1-D-myo-inositol-2-amino-2-deoxy-alpha-D-glucopyranoside deacetylase
MDMSRSDQRLLAVHAHPDDETIGTGVTMAKYVAEGAHVTLVTCTLGEEGEVLVPELGYLAAHEKDELGAHRRVELAEALALLGVSDHEYLGGPGRYRDSGMMGTPANDHPQSFWRADLLEAATYLVGTIRRTRPQVVVTYDDFGQYGHPDHIQAHRVTSYGTALPKAAVERGIAAFVEAGGQGFFGLADGEELPWALDDSLVTTAIVALDQEPHKMAALRAHLTQVGVENDFFRLSELVGPEAMGIEYFRLVRGQIGELGADGLEEDLFAGIDTPSG